MQQDDAQRPPRVDPETIAAAESLAGIEFTPTEREQMARGLGAPRGWAAWRSAAPLENALQVAHTFDPFRTAGVEGVLEQRGRVRLEERAFESRPANEDAIAFASVREQAHWLRTGELTSLELTELYLARIARLDPKLEAVITVTAERARAEARRADEELASGLDRGMLHGLPYAAKDLFDTGGIRTTWGAEPWSDRVPSTDAEVVTRLGAAGAVLIAKSSLGALAYGDRWLDRRTNSPWNLERGSSGSSAGSAAGTAAGLWSFSLGTETYGSIVSPSMRCGTTGLRPTFGRIPRSGAMALCWSLDKVGPITRSVEDALLVLQALDGPDAVDLDSRAMPLDFDGARSVAGLRVGIPKDAFEDANDVRARDALIELGVEPVEYEPPSLPYGGLLPILTVEAAAAFEELTRGGDDDRLAWQDPEAWPNTFRENWFVPAIELVQSQRLRTRVARAWEESLGDLDAVLTPSFHGPFLLATNFTGHPALCLRAGFESGEPRGVTLWGRLAGEGRLCELGIALERELDVWRRRPEL